MVDKLQSCRQGGGASITILLALPRQRNKQSLVTLHVEEEPMVPNPKYT